MTESRCAARESIERHHPDTGTVLVAVDDHHDGRDALEWAAAEAAARGAALQIVYAVSTAPTAVEALVGMPATQAYVGVEQAAALVLDEAAEHAREVAPALSVSTDLRPGASGTTAVREVCADDLVVVGRGRRPGWAASAGQAGVPVVFVGLSDEAVHGQSSGRVVVDSGAGPAALDFAFQAARRRDVGLTVVRTERRARPDLDGHAAAFPDVDVRRQVVVGPIGPALVNEAAGAALLVIGARPHKLRTIVGSTARFVLRHTRGPVAVVGNHK